MDFQQTIAEVTQELADAGFVRDTIKKQLEKTIVETVAGVLNSYGPVGKALEKQIEGEMVLNLSRMSVAGYADTLLPLIRQQIDETVIASATGPIEQMVRKYLTKLEKTSWKISEIVEKFREDKADYHDGDESFYFEAKVPDWSDKCLFVAFDEEEKKSTSYGSKSITRYEAKYQLFFREGRLVDFSIDKRRPNFKDVTDLGGFDMFLFNLYVNHVEVVDDSEDVSDDWHPDRDY